MRQSLADGAGGALCGLNLGKRHTTQLDGLRVVCGDRSGLSNKDRTRPNSHESAKQPMLARTML